MKHTLTFYIIRYAQIYNNLYFSLAAPEKVKSGIRRLIGWFCGMDGGSQTPEQEVAEVPEELPDISEDPMWKHFVDANPIIMMAVAVFMWGYFA